jgi:hypothetical protein
VPPPKEELVYEEEVKGLGYDEFKTLFKTSLDGVNMNVLDVIEVSQGEPQVFHILGVQPLLRGGYS